MHLREIPRDDWPDFCEAFTRQHRGWLASLLRVDPWGESELLVRDRSLDSIFPGAEEPEADEAEVFCVTLNGGEPAMLAVDAPRRIWVAETDERGHQAVRVDSADGASTVVVFRVPAASETVDGLTGAEEQ